MKRVVLGEGKGLLVEDGTIFAVSNEPEEYGYHWKRRWRGKRVRLVAEILPRRKWRKK